jgi:hypothetical protein
MSQFEYIMVLLSIVLGLGITHLLLGLGSLFYRLSVHGTPVRLDWVHLVWVAFVFTWLIGFWWWDYSWSAVEHWGLLLYMFLVLYAVCLFLLCVVLFPHQANEVADFRVYFIAVRRWFFGLLLIAAGLDLAEGVLKGPEYLAELGPITWITYAALAVAGIIGIQTKNRALQGVTAILVFGLNLLQLLTTYPLLGP